MLILLAHTFHALQPLDVNYFKPFKLAFMKEKDNSMIRNNHLELDKVTLASWVDKTLNQSLSKQNILNGFRATWVWPLNPKAMDDKTNPNSMYTTRDDNKHTNENIQNLNDEGNDSP